jgi:16S rRNA (cytosine1402-N4)-methyltransferase
MPGGRLLGIDKDPEVIQAAGVRLRPYDGAFRLVQGSYAQIHDIAFALGFEDADGILLDLGFSSYHIERSERGFSFAKDEPLDMRFDPRHGVSAADLVNRSSRSDLCDLLTRYGGDRNARANAQAIERARERQPIETTYQLSRAILARTPWRGGSHHPATQVFQALRVAVNDEVGRLRRSLDAAARALRAGGRLAVIAFHSIDDGMVKRYPAENAHVAALTKRPEVPSDAEVQTNPASRSARLRVLERVP